MASFLTTNFSHTYAGQEFLQELFFQPQSEGRDPFELYRVMENIDGSRNIYIPNALSKVLKKYTTCGFSSSGSTTISDKTITVQKVKVNLEECEDSFDDTILGELRKKGTKIEDLTGTDIEDMVRELTMGALRYDIPRVAWMAKSTSFSTDWNHFDGFFQLFFDSSASICTLDMSLNSNIETSASDDTLVTDGALVALRQMWTDQGAVLRSVPRDMKKFYVTSTIYDNLLVTYENTGTDVGLTQLADGIGTLKFRGVEIVEMPHWDTTLADVDNPMKALIGNNAIVYTMPENLIVGCDVNDPSTEVDTFYERSAETLRTKLKFKLGVQYVHDEYVCFAF